MSASLRGAIVTGATVTADYYVGDYRVLSLSAPAVATLAQPGQFVSLEQRAAGHILRRPFSILSAHNGVLQVGFDIVGDGTEWLASRRRGDEVGIIGPLGRPYTTPRDGDALLVGGGYGAAPLIFLAERLREAKSSVHTTMILGAATNQRLFLAERAAAVAGRLIITTDDGSAGVRGRVTDAMAGVEADVVYACGPMPMLAAVTQATEAPVEVAVEEFMACGIGVCWTCVVPTHEDCYRHRVRSCIEGPVFDGRAIAWA
jgi:dihydroorotate dehydrogenase electron transfer subunit